MALKNLTRKWCAKRRSKGGRSLWFVNCFVASKLGVVGKLSTNIFDCGLNEVRDDVELKIENVWYALVAVRNCKFWKKLLSTLCVRSESKISFKARKKFKLSSRQNGFYVSHISERQKCFLARSKNFFMLVNYSIDKLIQVNLLSRFRLLLSSAKRLSIQLKYHCYLPAITTQSSISSPRRLQLGHSLFLDQQSAEIGRQWCWAHFFRSSIVENVDILVGL